MSAGKSSLLLQSAHNYTESCKKVLLYKPSTDTRSIEITSRLGLSEQCLPIHPLLNIFTDVSTIVSNNNNNNIGMINDINCIFIDEAQFLNKEQVLQLCEIVDKLKIHVLCYGLRTDFMGNLFEGSKYLLALADKLVEIKSICHYCNKKSIMSLRVNSFNEVITDGPQIECSFSYLSVCRAHYFEKFETVEKLK